MINYFRLMLFRLEFEIGRQYIGLNPGTTITCSYSYFKTMEGFVPATFLT